MPGYSLFELLVVLAVIAFAAMLAPPAVNALRPELQIEKIADDLTGQLRLARSQAVTGGEAVLFTIDIDGDRLRLDGAGDEDGWIAAPRGVKLRVSDRNPADGGEQNTNHEGVIFYPDGSASGLDISFAAKHAIWHVTTSLNGKTTVTREPAPRG